MRVLRPYITYKAHPKTWPHVIGHRIDWQSMGWCQWCPKKLSQGDFFRSFFFLRRSVTRSDDGDLFWPRPVGIFGLHHFHGIQGFESTENFTKNHVFSIQFRQGTFRDLWRHSNIVSITNITPYHTISKNINIWYCPRNKFNGSGNILALKWMIPLQSRARKVNMNLELLVFGPRFTIDSKPRLWCKSVKFSSAKVGP